MSLYTVHKLNVRQLKSAKVAGLTFAREATLTVVTFVQLISDVSYVAKPASRMVNTLVQVIDIV